MRNNLQKIGESINLENEENSSGEISLYLKAAGEVARMAGPFTLSRLSVAINGICTALILKEIGPVAVASGPLISTMTFAVMGTVRGGLLAGGILIGQANKSGDKVILGDIVRQGWVLSVLFGIPAALLLANINYVLSVCGIEEEISDCVGDYFKAFAPGVVPIFCLATDQQLAIGIKRPNVTLVVGSVFAGLSMALGYPLALGLGPLPSLGVAGIGIGSSLSAYLSMIGLRFYYYFNNNYREFRLFELRSEEVLKGLPAFLRTGVPLGLQQFSEWGNLALISLLIGRHGRESLMAEQVSLQLMALFNFGLLGLAQASGVMVANALGQIIQNQKAVGQGAASTALLVKGLKRLGNVSILMAFSSAVVMSTLFFSIPNQLSSLLIRGDWQDAPSAGTDVQEETFTVAKNMLYTNGVGLLLDSVRLSAMGTLRGYKDIVFPSLVSFLLMSVIGITLGVIFTSVLDKGVDWLFITRDIGLFLSAGILLFRWMQKGEPSSSLPAVSLAAPSIQQEASPASRDETQRQFLPRDYISNHLSNFGTFGKYREGDDEAPWVEQAHKSNCETYCILQ